ncbi:unnamed protein product [Linum tenue]|nr:unnamed protein product [Linum tenue]
MEIRSL